jgi:hypothetical protein
MAVNGTTLELERSVGLQQCPNLWYYADICLENLTGTIEYLNVVPIQIEQVISKYQVKVFTVSSCI